MVQETNTSRQLEKQEVPQLSAITIVKEFQQLESSQDVQKTIQEPKNSTKYRADIDGLRTIAVGIVVIFHAWPYFMPGGFIGVDIFFVISGYLISGIIIKQTQKNKFSYTDFYSRRIKRIYPALIVVLIFVLNLGMRKLMKKSFEIMSKTMVASTIFAANLQILTAQTDYFDPETQSNPLLHLWSLGVEEQFYIFWPILLTVVFKKFPRKAFHILSGYTIISFALSIFCVLNDTQFAFYFPFCRFWQMSIGGLIVCLNLKINNKIINNIMSLVSMVAIMILVWTIDEDSLFPGFWALIPTLGAAFIIQAGSNSLINKYILSSKPFVFIGKISYPLYLWHWPLLVFSRMLYPEGSESLLSRPQIIVLISVCFSIITYYLVENSFRFRKQKIVPIALFIIIIGIGVTTYYTGSYKNNSQQFAQQDKSNFEEKNDEVITSEELEIQEKKNTEVQQNPNKKQTEQKKPIDPWVPLQEDYIIKNGRKIPNSSKNPRRQPTSVQKIKSSRRQKMLTEKEINSQILLQKKIDENSKYYHKEATQVINHFQVLNEGQQKVIFIIGDSHGRFILNRFKKLYQDSIKQGNQKSFPTIVSIVKVGENFVPKNKVYQISMQLIQKHKPDRVFFVYRWIRCIKIMRQMRKMPKKQIEGFQKGMQIMQSAIMEMKETGAQIYLAGIQPCGLIYDPYQMMDENGVIQNNIKPFKYSTFNNQYIEYFDTFNSVVQNVGAKVLDFTDNMCYNDTCQLLTPNGYPIIIDRNHFTQEYARNWAGIVDSITQF